MYNEYFGFKEAPFSIAPDPRYLYMTAQHREALAHLVYGLNSEGGCILLTGEVGTGKTTICRCLLEQIPEQANVALVLNPKVDEIELLETICDELNIDYPDTDNSLKTYTDRIYDYLITRNHNDEKTVLIIDEAQNLDSKVLEQLRLLTNLETNQRKLLQIIILGQPELLDILARTEMRQLAQRITARFHLQPLTKYEVKAYIGHRLAVAGQNIQLFQGNSIKLLFKFSKGIPRLINIICDRALLGAYVEEQYSVSPATVKKAAAEVFGELKNVERQQRNKQWLYPVAILASLALVVTATLIYSSKAEKKNDENRVSTSSIQHPDATSASDTNDIATSDEIKKMPEPEQSADTGPRATPSITETRNSDRISEASADTDSDSIDNILDGDSNDLASAYEQLFHAWGQHYNEKTSTTACRQAASYSLGCLHKLGNLNSLRVHDRPAVLTLIDKKGKSHHVTITSISDDTATVFSNNIAYNVRLHDLDKYWYGQFILLWHKPKGYSSAITPGDDGDMVSWLSHQLAKINNDTSDAIITRYDDYLIDKVIAFQTGQGLTADGIVGPVTIIHLNTLSGQQAPSLISPPMPLLTEKG